MKKTNAARVLDRLKIIYESAFRFPSILVSAGVRGLQLKLNPEDLFKAIKLIAGKLTVK